MRSLSSFLGGGSQEPEIVSVKQHLDVKEKLNHNLQTVQLSATEACLHNTAHYEQEIVRPISNIQTMSCGLQAEKDKARKETAQLHAQIDTINQMNAKFRQMVVPVCEKHVSDDHVVQQFTSLRSRILVGVRQIWTLSLGDDINIALLPKPYQDFFLARIPFSYDRLRSAVSLFLHAGIFEAPSYFLGNCFQEFDEQIQKVERDLFRYSPVENLKDAMDWRHAGFKATEPFRGDCRQLSLIMQGQIWNFLSPMQLLEPAEPDAVGKRLETICDGAVEFHAAIRQLKDNFWVDNIERAVGEPISQGDEFAEQMEHVQVVDGKQPGTIAYVIAGALAKSPKENLSKILVLEKAEVAVYSQATNQMM